MDTILSSLRSYSASPKFRTYSLLALALSWCAFLLAFRVAWTRNLNYTFLVWNLGLAVAPLVFSELLTTQSKRYLRITFATLWLLFFPNAPYIITDLIHLRTIQSGPIWFDILLVTSSAATGLAMGYLSLAQIQEHYSAQKPVVGWLIAITALSLASFGIYLGRFLRWRSIDIALNPLGLFADITDRLFNPFTHPRTWGVTLGFTVFLTVGYLFFRSGGAPLRGKTQHFRNKSANDSP